MFLFFQQSIFEITKKMSCTNPNVNSSLQMIWKFKKKQTKQILILFFSMLTHISFCVVYKREDYIRILMKFKIIIWWQTLKRRVISLWCATHRGIILLFYFLGFGLRSTFFQNFTDEKKKNNNLENFFSFFLF